MRGVNCDPLNPGGRPSAAEIQDSGFDSVRFVLRNDNASRAFHAACKSAGLDVLGVVTHATLVSYGVPVPVTLTLQIIDAQEAAIRGAVTSAINDHPGLIGLECGDEPDGTEGASWVMEKDVYVRFHNICADEAFKQAITICTGGLSSGQPGWFRDVVDLLSFDVLLVHPYAKSPEPARSLIKDYKTLLPAGKRFGASEWFRDESVEITEFTDMLDEERSWGNFFFCWSNAMVAGMGIRDVDGSTTAVGAVLSNHLRTTVATA